MESGDGICIGGRNRNRPSCKDKKAKDAVCGSDETDEDSGIRLSEYRAGQSEKEQQGYLLCEGKL